MTSYFGESRDTVYCALEKEVLHMCLSRILSSKFRDAALKNLMSLTGILLLLPS